METILRGSARDVVIGAERPFVIIGEKINPTGNKRLGAALHAGNLDLVRELAQHRARSGDERGELAGGPRELCDARSRPPAAAAAPSPGASRSSRCRRLTAFRRHVASWGLLRGAGYRLLGEIVRSAATPSRTFGPLPSGSGSRFCSRSRAIIAR